MQMPEEDLTVLSHFSHKHPMEPAKPPPAAANITCSGCNFNILSGKDYYTCRICPFSLHQICYNMPRKIQHPAHPTHHLALLVMPQSAKDTFKCKACEQHVTGFYYNCAQCGIFYHILCSVLPLSVSISSHPHRLKLEFSPPYDFSCDLCNKASYNGWLYRCDICEFDTHLACAISNNTLTRPGMRPVAAQDNELMQLIAQGLVGHEIGDGLAPDCPKESFESNMSDGWIGKSDMAAGSQHYHQDQSTAVSEDLTTSSYQISSCFSIDLAKTYPSDYCNDQVSKEGSSYCGIKGVPEIKKAFSFGNSTIMANSKQAKQELSVADTPGFDFHSMGSENKQNRSFSIEKLSKQQQYITKEDINGSRRNTSFSNQNATTDIESSSWKLFGCC